MIHMLKQIVGCLKDAPNLWLGNVGQFTHKIFKREGLVKLHDILQAFGYYRTVAMLTSIYTFQANYNAQIKNSTNTRVICTSY